MFLSNSSPKHLVPKHKPSTNQQNMILKKEKKKEKRIQKNMNPGEQTVFGCSFSESKGLRDEKTNGILGLSPKTNQGTAMPSI